MKEKAEEGEKKGRNPEALGEAGASPPFIQCCASWRNNAPSPLVPSLGKDEVKGEKWRPSGLPARNWDPSPSSSFGMGTMGVEKESEEDEKEKTEEGRKG